MINQDKPQAVPADQRGSSGPGWTINNSVMWGTYVFEISIIISLSFFAKVFIFGCLSTTFYSNCSYTSNRYEKQVIGDLKTRDCDHVIMWPCDHDDNVFIV